MKTTSAPPRSRERSCFEFFYVQVKRLPVSHSSEVSTAKARNQPQARLPVGEDAHHPTAALYLLGGLPGGVSSIYSGNVRCTLRRVEESLCYSVKA